MGFVYYLDVLIYNVLTNTLNINNTEGQNVHFILHLKNLSPEKRGIRYNRWVWCSWETTTAERKEKTPSPLGQTYTTWEENIWSTNITILYWCAALSAMRWPFVWPTLDGRPVVHPCVLQSGFVASEGGHSLLWPVLVEDDAHRQPGRICKQQIWDSTNY